MALPGYEETPEQYLQRHGSVMAPSKGTLQALTDFFFGSTPAERLANYGTAGLGAIVGEGARGTALASAAKQSLAEPFRKALDLGMVRPAAKRARPGTQATWAAERAPIGDIPLRAPLDRKEFARLLLEAEPSLLDMPQEFLGGIQGAYSLPREGFAGQLLIGGTHPRTSPLQTAIHEVTHPAGYQLRPSTAEVLRKSFLRRSSDIMDQMAEAGQLGGPELLYLQDLFKHSATQEGRNAVSELLSRAAEGMFLPIGPERHLLSEAGRYGAQSRWLASTKRPEAITQNEMFKEVMRMMGSQTSMP